MCYFNGHIPYKHPPNTPFCLIQVSAFLSFTVKDTAVIMRLLKSSNRFVAMYFPLNYRFIFTKKNTLYMILISVVLLGVIHTPFFIEYINCEVNLDAIGIIYVESCSLIYNNVETILEVLIYILCLLADIACLIMLRKMLQDPTSMSNQQERTRDKILVMQNCGNLAAIICSFIPYALYAFSTCTYLTVFGLTNTWNQTFLTYNVWASLENINRSSIKRVIGHAVDETVTLFLQGRLAQIKLEETTFTQVVSLNQIPTNEGHQFYNRLLKLKEFFVQLFRR